ncbi:MAG: glycosyltransferase family 4 protein [Anaerolineae bacterium]
MPNLMIAAGIFHPESGGPATYLKEILPALQVLGWQPSVVTYGEGSTSDYPYPVHRIPRQILPLRLFNYWRTARELAPHADLIYAHTIDLPVYGAHRPRLIKIVGDQAWERCIRKGWIAPTTDIDAFQHQQQGGLAERQKASRSRQVRAFDGVIVPSDYLKQMVIGWGMPAGRVHVIYNALPPAIEGLPPTQAAARQLLGWDDDAPTILTAARLTPWKGIDHLIEALKRVPDVRLMVAGDGDEMPRLRQLAQALGERVQLLGRVPRERLYTMMKASDYFALYSGYEGLPHTILEALRVGTPIIASDKGGNPEVVRHEQNGLLVPYVDVSQLTQAIERAFAEGQRAQFAEQTSQGMARFAFDQMVSQTDAVLRAYLRD